MSELRSSEIQKQEALESLRSIPLFSRVNQADLEQIASLLIERRLPRGSRVVEEGLPGDYMYLSLIHISEPTRPY